MTRPRAAVACCCAATLLAGCASRAVDVAPIAASPLLYAGWPCERIDDEADAVQQRAAEVAWSVDEQVGNNVAALGIGIAVFWPALLALRPDGADADELARLKGRYAALRNAARARGCQPPTLELPPARAARWPLAPGDRLVYEQRDGARGPATTWALRLTALRRDAAEFQLERGGQPPAPWRQDLAGNVVMAPAGTLSWAHFLRREPVAGQVLAGAIELQGEPFVRARMRGRVAAVGSETAAGRRFDTAVAVELFGDAELGDSLTRVDGTLVYDRDSGVLLRLELHSAAPIFELQRRLVRIEPAPQP